MSNPLADCRALQAASAYLHPFKGRALDPSRRVRVYRNLHAKTAEDRYSILQNGLVVAHAPYVLLTDVRFVVLPAAWRRSLKLGRKIVCAFAEGFITERAANITATSEQGLSTSAHFNRATGKFILNGPFKLPCARAGVALLNAQGLTVHAAVTQP